MKYLIDFVNTATDSEISTYLADNGCAVIKEWDNYDKVFLVECSVEPPKTSIIQFVVNDEDELAIKPHDHVHFNPYYQTSHPDKLETISTSDQKDWWKNYSLQNPVFDQPTTTITRKGEHISVYVVDSGIEASHPDFVDTNITNIYSVTGEFNDTSGHGTSLASLISGKTCGITNAKIKVVKIFDDNHTTMQSEFLDAMDAIINDLQDNSFAIINCSWTIPRNAWVEHKLKILIDKGAIIMAAAGNNGTSIEDVTPAAMPEAFTIGSYNMDLLPSDFSNYTDSSHVSLTAGHTNSGELDGWAPGENIYSARLTSKGSGYAFAGGTSQATAICSAVLAHNFADEVDENGLRNASYVNIPPDVLKKSAIARKGILDLSDPKYASSVNVIATLFDLKSMQVTLPADELISSVRVGQAQILGQVFQAHNTKQVEIIQPLPDNFVIIPNGMLHGAPVESQGPAEGETYKEYTSVVRRTNLDDTVEDVTITIYVLASNFDPGTLPPEHPIVVTLESGCNHAGSGFSCVLATNPPCSNNCRSSNCCDPGGKSNTCFCLAFSDRRLKSNIKKIGTHSLGIGYYEYDIFGKTEQGVMADELLTVKPESLIKGNDGYYRVNYCMIGRQFA